MKADKPIKLALIGLGPHAQRIYYPYIETCLKRGDVVFSLVIDIASAADKVDAYIAERTVSPERVVYIPTDDAYEPTIHPKAIEAIRSLGVTHVIIATEPKAHKAYLDFCIENDLKILTDKPITSPIGLMPHPRFQTSEEMFNAAERITEDVESLLKKLEEHPKSRVIVQTQRRYHAGYNFIIDFLKSAIKEYGVPITYIGIHHSDGMWNMPAELMSRENHPYKYGYGKLMHSGYHFIDLFSNLMKLNEQLENKVADKFSVFSQILRPIDHHVTINPEDYQKFFGEGDFKLPKNHQGVDDYESFGELDNFSQWQFTKEGKVITTAQLSLMQSGLSLRAWPNLPEDTYKANGRVRHEMVNIHVGALYNIQVHSYQAAEIGDDEVRKQGVGSKNHFDIYIFKNSKLLGGKPLEVIHYGDSDIKTHSDDAIYLGQNEQPRYQAVDELLNDTVSKSELYDHLTTNRLMSVLYSNQAKQQFDQVPYAEYVYKEIFDE